MASRDGRTPGALRPRLRSLLVLVLAVLMLRLLDESARLAPAAPLQELTQHAAIGGGDVLRPCERLVGGGKLGLELLPGSAHRLDLARLMV